MAWVGFFRSKANCGPSSNGDGRLEPSNRRTAQRRSASRSFIVLVKATALTQLTRGDRWPQFLPDGERFLFYSQENHAVYLRSLEGGEPTRLLAADSAAAYAPPGYLLLVSQGVLVARRFDAARGAVIGDPLPIAPTVYREAGTFRGAFSVSATGVLAYRGGAGNRRELVWVDHAGKSLGVVLPPEDTGLTSLDLAPNEKQAAVSRIVQGDLDVWLIEVARGIPSRFTFDRAASPVWSPDGSRLALRSIRTDKDVVLFTTRLTTGNTGIGGYTSRAQYAVAADGRFLLNVSADDATASPITIVQNWTAGLKP
jgi:hypothetical protein